MKYAKVKAKLKTAAGDILAIVSAFLGVIPGLLKKKPFTLWRWSRPAKVWENCGTYSARQCRKAMNELVRLGDDPALFAILRKGVPPPKDGPK